MESPRNRKQRRAAAAASTSKKNDSFDPSSIPMRRPTKQQPQGKTLVDLIAERQNELVGHADAPSGSGTRFVTIDPSTGEISQADGLDFSGQRNRNQSHGFVEEIPSDEDDESPQDSKDGSDSDQASAHDNEPLIPPFIDTLLLSIPLTTLHLTLAYLAAHQYAESIDMDRLFRESGFIAFPILTLLIHLAHGHIVSAIGASTSSKEAEAETVSLFPWSSDKLSLAFLRQLVFPPTWRTLVFLPLAVGLGMKLMTITNEDPYYAVMKRAPAIGTLWVWCILEIPLGATVLGALGPLAWGVWWRGYGIF